MSNLISVIVPVYNVEKYLDKCIKSIVNQTYQNLEIILIDDGSTDESAKICDLWAEKDERITVIHKANGGVSSARNMGLEHASGDYIGFIDSDDFIENDFYELLLNNMNEYNADVSRCIYRYAYDDGHTKASDELNEDIVVFDNNIDVLNDLHNSGHKSVVLWNKLYKASILKNVRFDELLKVGEDVVFNYFAFKKANRMVCQDIPKYNYRMRECSSRYYDGYNFQASRSMKVIIDDPECPVALYSKYFTFATMALHDIVVDGFNYSFDELRKEILQYKREINDSLTDKTAKAKLFLLMVSGRLYKLLLKRGR